MYLDKRVGESDFDYHKRIIIGKLVDKALPDTDYSELSSILYGQQFTSDHVRKMMRGSLHTLELLDKADAEKVRDSSAAAEIERRTRELQKEKERFYDQRREYNKLIRDDARFEHIMESLRESAKNLSESVGTVFDNRKPFEVTGDNEAILVLSDWHYGMVTDNIFNKFDTAICRERVKNVMVNAIDRIKLHGCRKVHIVLLGDFVHGGIHVSTRVASEEYIADQLMHVSEILAQCVDEVSNYVDEVVVYSTYGNHGRIIPNKEESIHKDNIERIIGWWLKERLSDNHKVRFEDDRDGYLFINANGHDVCAIHGDIDNVKQSPRLITTLMYKGAGKNIECIILGDQHHRESFEELGVVSMICGSLCGTDDYANDKRLFSTPSQLLLVFDEDGLDAEYRLKCE